MELHVNTSDAGCGFNMLSFSQYVFVFLSFFSFVFVSLFVSVFVYLFLAVFVTYVATSTQVSEIGRGINMLSFSQYDDN